MTAEAKVPRWRRMLPATSGQWVYALLLAGGVQFGFAGAGFVDGRLHPGILLTWACLGLAFWACAGVVWLWARRRV